MILSKEDLLEYMACDKRALGLAGKSRRACSRNRIWRFEKALRRAEYANNCCRRLWQKPYVKLCNLIYRRRGERLGFTIPLHVFGKGLSIAHAGTIVVNGAARVGEYCRLHVCVNIETQAGQGTAAPIIGDRVYIAPGAKLFGAIRIADDIAIGANAVVNKSFETPGVTVAGVPARVISNKGSFGLLYAGQNPAAQDRKQ